MKLIGIIGWKNSGKTTLTTKLITHFTAQGLRVATLKRTHHAVDLDPGGTDSARHRAAGAAQVMLASDKRTTLITELETPPSLEALARQLAPSDLVIAEGWKNGTHPRIECHRQACQQPPLAQTDPSILAVATDHPLDVAQPQFDLDKVDDIAPFILTHL